MSKAQLNQQQKVIHIIKHLFKMYKSDNLKPPFFIRELSVYSFPFYSLAPLCPQKNKELVGGLCLLVPKAMALNPRTHKEAECCFILGSPMIQPAIGLLLVIY